MDKYDLFKKKVVKVADAFKKIDKKECIRVISHLDSDGITSAAIFLNAMNNRKHCYCLRIIKQLSDEILQELKKEKYTYYVFTDLGSGQYDLIKRYLGDRKILILDHHNYDTSIKEKLPKNITLVNPHSYDIDGSTEISGAGVVYLFAEALNEKNKKTAHLAVIGAIGDVQENDGFPELTKEILKTAISQGKIQVQRSLKWFGMETRSLVKLLTYSNDIEIPEINHNESNVIMFLQEVDINPKKGNEWRTYSDLSEKEKEKLTSAIIIKRQKLKNPEDIFAKRYILPKEKKGTPFRDAKEFSTLLNACGRMGEAHYGVGACLNDKKSKKKALEVLQSYRESIVAALRWYNENKNTDKVILNKKYIIINAKDEIRSTIIGTVASIISNQEDIKPGTIILSVAEDGQAGKASIRIKGDYKLDLRDVIKDILKEVEGEGGGHKTAAGAVLNSKDEIDDFVKRSVKVLDKVKVK